MSTTVSAIANYTTPPCVLRASLPTYCIGLVVCCAFAFARLWHCNSAPSNKNASSSNSRQFLSYRVLCFEPPFDMQSHFAKYYRPHPVPPIVLHVLVSSHGFLPSPRFRLCSYWKHRITRRPTLLEVRIWAQLEGANHFLVPGRSLAQRRYTEQVP